MPAMVGSATPALDLNRGGSGEKRWWRHGGGRPEGSLAGDGMYAAGDGAAWDLEQFTRCTTRGRRGGGAGRGGSRQRRRRPDRRGKNRQTKNDGPRSRGRPRGKKTYYFFRHFVLFRSRDYDQKKLNKKEKKTVGPAWPT
jgi:hypothetical protein